MKHTSPVVQDIDTKYKEIARVQAMIDTLRTNELNRNRSHISELRTWQEYACQRVAQLLDQSAPVVVAEPEESSPMKGFRQTLK
jgi:hypothetical protein